MSGAFDDVDLGKAYDRALLARLWTLVRPYRAVFWGALGCSLANQACTLVQPLLVKTGIDRYVSAHDPAGLRLVALCDCDELVLDGWDDWRL